MTGRFPQENPDAGQGAVLLDIGGDVGALVVMMPAAMEGMEVEIRPISVHRRGTGAVQHPHDHTHRSGHTDDYSVRHHPHVAVVKRPVQGTHVASLVFPELIEGRYELYPKGTDDVSLTVDVHGGEVSNAAWPPRTASP